MAFALHVNSSRRSELRPISSIGMLTEQLNRSTLTDQSQRLIKNLSVAGSQDVFNSSPYTVSPESSQDTSEHEDEGHNTNWERVSKSNEESAGEFVNFSVSAPPSNSFMGYHQHPRCPHVCSHCYRNCRHFARHDAPCSGSGPQVAGTTWSYPNYHQTTTTMYPSFRSTTYIKPNFTQSSHGCIGCTSPCQVAPDHCSCTLETSSYCLPAKRACRSVSAGISTYGCQHSNMSCTHSSSLKLKPLEAHMNKLPRPIALRGGPPQDICDASATLTRHTVHGLVALRPRQRERVLRSRYSWHYPSSLQSASTKHIPQTAGDELRSTVHLQGAGMSSNAQLGRSASRYSSFTYSSKYSCRVPSNTIDATSVGSSGADSDSLVPHSAGETTQVRPSAFSPMHVQPTVSGLHTLFSHCSLSPDVDSISSSAQLPPTRTPSSGFHDAPFGYWSEPSSLPDCSKVNELGPYFDYVQLKFNIFRTL